MSILCIGPDEKEAIQRATEIARANAIPWEQLKDYVLDSNREVVKLGDRPKGFERVQSQNVLIPVGYRAAISFEEQPAGILKHLSISVATKGKIPNVHAIIMIAEEFGFAVGKAGEGRTWLEEFAPGHFAVNLIQIESGVPQERKR